MFYNELDGIVDESELFSHLIMRGPVPALAFDKRNHLLFINEMASLLLGLRGDIQLADLLVSEFFVDPQQASRVRRDAEEYPTGDTLEVELLLRDMRGEPIPVRAYVECLRKDDAVVAYSAMFVDIRDMVALNRRLEDTTRQLLSAQQRFDTVERGRSVAHELNQPLTVAMGTLELLSATSAFPEPVMARLERIYEQLQRMARIVRRISMPTHGQQGYDEKLNMNA